MAPIDYAEIVVQALDEYTEIVRDRQLLDFELAKKRQFIKATLNMLPEDERECFESIFESIGGGELGLTDAIRKILQASPKKSFTATDVRNELKKSGFNFSSYTANPLASIHAVLRRLKPEEAEVTDIDGVAAWRWVGDISFSFGVVPGVPGATNILRERLGLPRNDSIQARNREAATKHLEKVAAQLKQIRENQKGDKG